VLYSSDPLWSIVWIFCRVNIFHIFHFAQSATLQGPYTNTAASWRPAHINAQTWILRGFPLGKNDDNPSDAARFLVTGRNGSPGRHPTWSRVKKLPPTSNPATHAEERNTTLKRCSRDRQIEMKNISQTHSTITLPSTIIYNYPFILNLLLSVSLK